MKKRSLILISLLLLSLFSFISLTLAQNEIPGIEQVPLVTEVQQGQQLYEQYTTAENKSTYLTQQWGSLLGRAKYLGPIVIGINNFFIILNPFFKIVLGYGYGLSWAFVFASIIWLIIFFFVNPILSQILKKGIFGLLASFAVASLVGISGVIKKAVDLLTTMINNAWIAWISLLIAIILVFLFEMIGRKIKAKIKTATMTAEEEKTRKAQQLVQTQGEIAKKELEAFSISDKPLESFFKD